MEVLGGRPMALAGVSLGAAVIIDFHAAHPEAVACAALIDPQGFIDGAPPVPEPFARAGIQVLGSWPLRSFANQLAYHDTATFATDDAIRVGLLHCARPGWADDSVDWLLGGGYSVSHLVPRLAAVNTLVMWGRQDQILPPQVRGQSSRAAPHRSAHSRRPPSDLCPPLMHAMLPRRIFCQNSCVHCPTPLSAGLKSAATHLTSSNPRFWPTLSPHSSEARLLQATRMCPR
eukprot:scaffold251_cov134-Isochrysis_galbana.AAC.8